MEIKWLIKGDKEKIRPVLSEWVKGVQKFVIENVEKRVKTPFGEMPFPIFTVDYEERENGFIYKQNLPIPDTKIFKGMLWLQLKRAKGQMKKYFESKGIKVEIDDVKQ